nr:caskin-1-like [Aegilops tauschii subsp. strangulata]
MPGRQDAEVTSPFLYAFSFLFPITLLLPDHPPHLVPFSHREPAPPPQLESTAVVASSPASVPAGSGREHAPLPVLGLPCVQLAPTADFLCSRPLFPHQRRPHLPAPKSPPPSPSARPAKSGAAILCLARAPTSSASPLRLKSRVAAALLRPHRFPPTASSPARRRNGCFPAGSRRPAMNPSLLDLLCAPPLPCII